MKRTVLCAVLGAALAPCGYAFAQDEAKGFYAGLSIGQSKFPGACDSEAGVTLSNCKDTDTAWKIFGGYQFTPNLALELGYNDFGRISSDATVTMGGTTFTGNARIEATAFELTGVGTWPLAHQFSVYGKLGVYYAETKSSANVQQTTPPFASGSSSASDNNTNLTFGVGARYDITRNIAVRAEWQRFSKVGGDSTGKGDIDVLAIGGLYRF
ncbi:MAG TPA: outer membrane beta-barrel protein [Burkholderiales bacterium]|nr:outer membrane beta-barrel protein [Burkholderiales bacterium]